VGPRAPGGRAGQGEALRRILATAFWGPLFVITFVTVCGSLLVLALVWPSVLYAAARRGCRLILRASGARVHFEGELPADGAYIVMANHSSFIDLFLLPAILPGRYTGVMAEEMMRVPLLEPVLKRLRVVPIVREQFERAVESLKRAEDALREGYHVAILPEGTRTTSGRMLPFKSGPFYVAMHTRVAIVPVGIAGAFEYKPKDRWTIDPGPVSVRIGRPIPPDEYDALGTTGLKERVRAEIASLAGQAAE
jgi:1-acyl-sn-glycerol-3-phosphate acyltransferase